MSILDFEDSYTPPFSPKRFEKETIDDNYEALNNLGHKEVSEDYSDEIEKL